MAFADLYCSRCSLQFDKTLIYDMHMSEVHKETDNIKEKQTCITLKEKPHKTKTKGPSTCEICCKTFSSLGSMTTHIASVHEKKETIQM